MKRYIFFILVSLFILMPIFSSQHASEKNLDPIDSFVDAMEKEEGTARINALKLYIKQFPETTSRWTRLAYFNIATEYYKIKNYAEAVKQGEKLFLIGKFGKGEEGRLALVLAESYGLKSSPVFNKKKAFQYIKIAISAAKASNDEELLKAAQNLEKQLSAAKPLTMSPEQKIKRLFSEKKFLEVISYYKTLNAADRSNPEIHKIYADALVKTNRYDAAIREKKREIRNLKKEIRNYEHETGHDAPPYMYEDLNKKEKELKELEAGGADFSKLAEYEKKIKELNETIQRELQEIRSKAKKRLK